MSDDWLSEDTPATEEAAVDAEIAAATTDAPADAGPTPADTADRPDSPPHFDPNRKIVFKHWTRPKFLQYNYMYDYRHNYYDDVINYLDKRQKGLSAELPRPQTWAERALRTYTKGITAHNEAHERDVALMSQIKTSGMFYRYHTKEYINKKYSSYLYR